MKPIYEELENFLVLQMSEDGDEEDGTACQCYSCSAGRPLARRADSGATVFVVENPGNGVWRRYQLDVSMARMNCVEILRGGAVRVYEGTDQVLRGHLTPVIETLLLIAKHDLALFLKG